MSIVTNEKTPARVAPISDSSITGWMKLNLFSTLTNTLFTFITLFIIYITLKGLWVWGIYDAVWVADTRRECFAISIDGACWAGIFDWLENIFYGRYPREELWRVDLGIGLLFVWMAPLWLPRVKSKMLIGISTVFLYPFLAGYLFSGGDKGLLMQLMISAALVSLLVSIIHSIIGFFSGRSLSEFIFELPGIESKSDKTKRLIFNGILVVAFGLAFIWQMSWAVTEVSWIKWGGLFLTLVIAGIGIASALPGGIILALGRRSELPIIRVLSTGFIEIFRSVPLITVLFMATTMFPLFMPEGVVLNKLTQVIIAVCLFNACYMAETVRAGLQTIPKGQFEAAHTIGLSYWGTMSFIIMPQALKHMIPNIVGSFIGLLKDTTLVSIIGLFDLLGMLNSISKDRQWLGLHKEPLIFGAIIFFLICFVMSKYSRHLEAKLSTVHKN